MIEFLDNVCNDSAFTVAVAIMALPETIILGIVYYMFWTDIWLSVLIAAMVYLWIILTAADA